MPASTEQAALPCCSGMTLQRPDLELVVELADGGSLSAAARRLHVAQPALSRRLAALERRLGGPLMERSRHGTTPTPAGRVLVERARAVLHQLELAEHAVGEALAGRAGGLRLGTTPTLGADLLPALLGRLRDAHPGLSVDLRTSGDSPRLRAEVAAGDLDAALAVVDRRSPGTTVLLRGRQRFALVLPADHPLAARAAVDRSELVDLALVALPAGEGLRVLLDSLLTELDARPRIAVEAEHRELLVPLVAAGLGATLLPEGFARERATADVAVATLRPPVERPVGMVVPAVDRLPAATASLRDAVADVTGWA